MTALDQATGVERVQSTGPRWVGKKGVGGWWEGRKHHHAHAHAHPPPLSRGDAREDGGVGGAHHHPHVPHVLVASLPPLPHP